MGSPSYLSWVRRQPCLGCGVEPAGEAYHTSRHGVAQKPPDEQAVPLCGACHQSLHDLTGPFRGFERRHRKAWEALVLMATRNRYRAAASKHAAPAEETF